MPQDEVEAMERESLIEKLERFIATPEWPRFYMDKEQAGQCVAALKGSAQEQG